MAFSPRIVGLEDPKAWIKDKAWSDVFPDTRTRDRLLSVVLETYQRRLIHEKKFCINEAGAIIC